MKTRRQQILDFYLRPAAVASTGGRARRLALHAADVGHEARTRIITGGSLAILLAVLIAAGCGAVRAQERAVRQYHVSHLPSLGGTISRGNSINDIGWVAGYSNLTGNGSRHATLWREGTVFDLGTLGGPNSNVPWPVKNTRGVLAGISQTATPDPLGERWSCAAFFPGATGTGYTCLGFVWEDGVMRALPTLGGNNGFATGVNNRGQVVGWAENAVRDRTCVAPQVLQFRAVLWETGKSRIKTNELLPLPGDTSSAATAVNDRGQVVGISGTCDQAVGRRTARRAVLWEGGGVTDIGNLGGETWNTAMAINQRGDVVGFASLPGGDADDPVLHAFLWTKRGGIRDLGTLPGDVTSEAHGINERRQVVGLSCDADGNCRAFLWDNGVMTDLNALVAPGYSAHLFMAQDINDDGQITGRAVDQSTSELPAFLAVPSAGDDRAGDHVAPPARRAKVVLPKHVRQTLRWQSRLGGAGLVAR